MDQAADSAALRQTCSGRPMADYGYAFDPSSPWGCRYNLLSPMPRTEKKQKKKSLKLLVRLFLLSEGIYVPSKLNKVFSMC